MSEESAPDDGPQSDEAWASLLRVVDSNENCFQKRGELGEGVAFHYTSHSDLISEHGAFLGRTINAAELDRTQAWDNPQSTPATDPYGVVFAYQTVDEAHEEGAIFNGTRVFRVDYRRAVRATHEQEAALGAGDTVLILAHDITGFDDLGEAAHPEGGSFSVGEAGQSQGGSEPE